MMRAVLPRAKEGGGVGDILGGVFLGFRDVDVRL